MSKQVTNIHLVPGGSTQVALACDYDGARFHVWISREKLLAGIIEPIVGGTFGIGARQSDNGEATLYKNPPLGVERGGPEDYKTRYLSLDGAIGRIVWPAMRMAVKRDELVEKMLVAEKAKEDAERAANIEAAKVYLAKEHGPALLELLQRVDRSGVRKELGATLSDEIRAAITAATTLPEHLR